MQFGDVERDDVETGGFDAGSGVWERGGKDDGVTNNEGIGCMGLFGSYVDPFVTKAGEWVRIEPGAVGQQGVAAEIGDGGF